MEFHGTARGPPEPSTGSDTPVQSSYNPAMRLGAQGGGFGGPGGSFGGGGNREATPTTMEATTRTTETTTRTNRKHSETGQTIRMTPMLELRTARVSSQVLLQGRA